MTPSLTHKWDRCAGQRACRYQFKVMLRFVFRWLRGALTDRLQDSVRARCREKWVDGDTEEAEADVYALTDADGDEAEELEI